MPPPWVARRALRGSSGGADSLDHGTRAPCASLAPRPKFVPSTLAPIESGPALAPHAAMLPPCVSRASSSSRSSSRAVDRPRSTRRPSAPRRVLRSRQRARQRRPRLRHRPLRRLRPRLPLHRPLHRPYSRLRAARAISSKSSTSRFFSAATSTRTPARAMGIAPSSRSTAGIAITTTPSSRSPITTSSRIRTCTDRQEKQASRWSRARRSPWPRTASPCM